MGKGGGTNKTVSTNYTSSLPAYAQPYYESIMQRAQTASKAPYITYGAPRLADFGGDTQDYFSGVRSLDAPPGLDTATAATQQGIDAAYGANYDPNSFQGGIFDNAAAQQYMNPYLTNVLDVQKSRALQAFGEQQADRNTQAVMNHALGGSGSYIRNQLAQNALNSQLQGIDAEGLFKAYDNASQLFDRDRMARLQAEQMGEQSKQFGAQFGLQGTQLGLQGAQQLAGLSELDQKLALDRLNALKEAGGMQDALQQKSLDIGYEDFINQRDWAKQQLGWLSGILHGVPVSANSNVTQTSPAPNLASQVAGAGLGIYGLQQASGQS